MSTLAHDQLKSWSMAKVRQCLGKMSSGEEAKTHQVKEFQVYCSVEEFLGIDGESN